VGSLPIINFSLPFKIASFFVYYLTLLAVIVFDHLVFNIRMKGRAILGRVGRAILVSNHTLYLDPALIAHLIAPRRTYFSAMESTFHRKLIGPYIRLLGAFPLPHHNPLQRTLKALRRALDERGMVHFFPEGELHHQSQEIHPFNDGAFYAAFLFDIPVVPIVTTLKKRRVRGLTFFPRVTMHVGQPIHPASFRTDKSRTKEGVAAMRESVREAMRQVVVSQH